MRAIVALGLFGLGFLWFSLMSACDGKAREALESAPIGLLVLVVTFFIGRRAVLRTLASERREAPEEPGTPGPGSGGAAP